MGPSQDMDPSWCLAHAVLPSRCCCVQITILTLISLLEELTEKDTIRIAAQAHGHKFYKPVNGICLLPIDALGMSLWQLPQLPHL